MSGDFFHIYFHLIEILLANFKVCSYTDVQLSVLSSLKTLHMNGYPNQIPSKGFSFLRNLEEIYIEGILAEITKKKKKKKKKKTSTI